MVAAEDQMAVNELRDFYPEMVAEPKNNDFKVSFKTNEVCAILKLYTGLYKSLNPSK